MSIISSIDAQRTYVKHHQWKVKITRFKYKSTIGPVAKGATGETKISRHQLAVISEKENVLDFDVCLIISCVVSNRVFAAKH